MAENNEKIDTTKAESKTTFLNMAILVLILGFAHLLDAFASNAGNYVQSSVLNEFDVSVSLSSLSGAIVLPFMLLQFLYKSAIDKHGRKKTLIIAIIGMGVGNLIKALAVNYWMFLIGTIINFYFMSVDVQVIYINEESPKKYRATIFSIAKVLGVLSVLIVPFLREIFISEDVERWRPIFFVPVIAAAVICLVAIFLLQESSAYKIAQEKQSNEGKSAVNFREAVKKLKKSKVWPRFKWILIISIPNMFYAVAWGYGEVFMDEAGILELDKNVIIRWALIFQAIIFALQGVVVDYWGRRPAYLSWACVFLISMIGEIYCINHYMLIPAGIFQGIKIGAYWNFGDVLGFMVVETVPTHLRGNAQGLRGLVVFGTTIVSLVTFSILSNFIPNLGTVFMIMGIPTILLAMVLFYFKTVETKGIDLTLIEE